MQAIQQTSVPGYTPMRGKVRDVYDLGDKMLIVATDRISAFDVVMANGIPYKGIVLTQISKFWFDFLSGQVEHHLLSDNVKDFPKPFADRADQFKGRSMLVKKVQVLPIECVIRGYLAGSGWKEYQRTGTVCGVKLYTDYGHNPAEIRNALTIASLAPHRELWAVWQPHTYSRTKNLFQGFVETFDHVDHLLITDIMASREKDPGDIHSTMLLSPICARGVDVHYTATFDDAEAYLRANWRAGDLVITHGCGDIDLLNEQIALHGDTLKEDGE